MLRKLFLVMLVISMVIGAMGCSSTEVNGSESDAETELPAEEPIEEEPAEPVKVGMVLPSPINDMGWSALAYNALMAIESSYDNVEVAFSESVPISDAEGVFRSYGDAGFDLIIGHGYQFNDAALAVAGDYPDVEFLVASGMGNGENVSSVAVDYTMQGFMTGIIAGTLSESGMVGGIGGIQIPPIIDQVKGFEAGSKYVNPDLEVLTAVTGSAEDSAMAKGVALAMAESGADIIMGSVTQASLGVVEACEESGAKYVGIDLDMHEAAPGSIINCVINDGDILYTYSFEQFLNGELQGGDYVFGIEEGALYLAGWYEFEEQISAEDMQTINALIAELGAGNIDHLGLASEIVVELP